MLYAYSQIYFPIVAMILLAISGAKIYAAGFRAPGVAIGVPSGIIAFAGVMSEIWSDWSNRFVFGPDGEVLWRAGQPNAWHDLLGYISPVGLLVIAVGLWVFSRQVATLNKKGLGTREQRAPKP